MMRSVFLLLLTIGTFVQAHEQSDVITMYNGDQITGEVRGLGFGDLRIKTGYAPEFSVEWWHVAKIESQYNFEISTADGRRLYGNLSSNDKNGQLVFTSVEDSFVINMLEVTEIRPIEDTLADAFSYTLGASLNLEPELATAQLKATIALATELTQSTGRLVLQESTTRLPKEGGDGYRRSSNASRMMSLNLEHQRWTNRQALYRTFTAGFDYNESLNNYGRVSLGAGLGKYFIDRAGLRFNGALGVQGVAEKNRYVEAVPIPPDATKTENRCVFNPSNQLIYEPSFELDVDPNDLPELEEITAILGQLEVRECKSNYATSKSVEAFAAGEIALYNLTDKDFDVRVMTNLYPSITESGRVRADIGAEIAWEMVANLFLTLSSTTQYDSGKPDDDITRNDKLDYNIVMGVSWRP